MKNWASSNKFFGRGREVAELVASESHITSIVGPAGCGKTRLAIEAASSSGVRFTVVSFASMTLASHAISVETMVADAAEEGGGVELVILDDCDHVLNTLVELLPLLSTGRTEVRFWVTARERLALADEHVINLAPLPEQTAVELLLDRVGWTDRSTDGVGDDATQIARLLDCLPLALEIAAGRLRLLGFAEFEARLADDLLELRSHAPLDRHRSLEAALDWSWQLLSEVERTVLCQLSVFNGRFSVEAAESIVEVDADLSPAASIDVFEMLLRRSLLVSTGLPGEKQPLALYSSVAAYARRRLAATPALGASASERHRAHFARLAKESRTSSSSVRLAEFSLDPELALSSVLAACERSIEIDDIDAAADLIVFASAAGSSARMVDLIDPLGRLIEHPRFAEIPPAEQVALLGLRGKYYFCVNDDVASESDHRRALALAEIAGLDNQQAYLTMGLGLLSSIAAVDGPADELFLAARELATRAGEVGLLEAIDLCRASRAFDSGELELAETLCTNVAVASDLRGDAATRAIATIRLAYVDLLRGELGSAAARFERAGDTCERLREIQYWAVCHRGLGMTEHLQGRFASALDHYRASVKLLLRRPSSRYLPISLALEAAAECAVGNGPRGRLLFDRLAKRRQHVSPVDQAVIAIYRLHRDPPSLEGVCAAADRVTEPSTRGYESRLARQVLEVVVDHWAGPTLVVSANCDAVTPPGRPVVKFGNRATLRRVFATLVARHEAEPGAVVKSEELIAAGWPAEVIRPDAARNRLRVAISGLRREGLGEIIETASGGYRLPEKLRIEHR